MRRVPVGVVLCLLKLFVALALAARATQTPSSVSFGVFTDLHAHDIDSPLEEKWMTHTAERLALFTDAMNAQAVDFVVELGDFVNGWIVFGADPGDPSRIPGILAWADGLYGAFAGPRYHVVGNHDVFNLDKEEIQRVLGLPSTSSSFDAGPFHFVLLDAQFGPDGSSLATTYSGVAGFIPTAELAWLRDDLAAHADRPTIVFVHQMLNAYIEEWGRPLVANQPDVVRTLEEAGNVVAIFQGHDHRAAHEVVGGIHYITLAALVDRGTPPAWATVTLDAATATARIEGVGLQPSFSFSWNAEGDAP